MKKSTRWLKIPLTVVLALVLAVGLYVAYVLIAYHRIGDQPLAAEGDAASPEAVVGQSYQVISYNIGFGAYESDYGFFMDGGSESRAWSKERLNRNLNNIASFLGEQQSDFYLIQEVDTDSTRSYHVDERQPLYQALSGMCHVFAQNYDSPYLMYPLLRPHGASKSGLLTFSSARIDAAQRTELPVESGFMKLLDLDRCYSACRIPVNGGKELILYNLHLSAYTSDGSIANQQLALLLADMQAEYDAGNWCVAGGDFNKDLLGDSSVWFGAADQQYSWAQPLPAGILDNYHISLAAPLDESHPVPNCRNADSAYHEGQYVLTVDGFLVSDNVTVESAAVLDTGFQWSDHNPVTMVFTLN